MDFALIPTNNDNSTVKNILAMNEKTSECSIIITQKDAEMIAAAAKDSVAEQDRVEFGKSVATEIIEKFMQSAYVDQENFADTIASLLEIFYEAKEEANDNLDDGELIDIMFYYFEHVSEGCIDLLQTRDLEVLCRRVRYAASNIYVDDPED